MGGRILRPNIGKKTKTLEEVASSIKRKSLPKEMYDLIKEMLVEFKFDPKRAMDVSAHVLNGDVDTALEDCIPMKVFFGMCANKYEEKEKLCEETLKIMMEGGLKGSEKISIQKGSIRKSKRYVEVYKKKIRMTRRKHDCRVLENAMEMRKDVSQTKSKNYRDGMSPGSYINNNQ